MCLHVLRMDGYKCQVARWFGRTEEAQTVHHIYPVKEYQEYQWCYWTMISAAFRLYHECKKESDDKVSREVFTREMIVSARY